MQKALQAPASPPKEAVPPSSAQGERAEPVAQGAVPCPQGELFAASGCSMQCMCASPCLLRGLGAVLLLHNQQRWAISRST
jgi:hypothetical protein